MVWTAWKNGSHKSATDYGLKVPIPDRDRLIGFVEQCDHQIRWFEIIDHDRKKCGHCCIDPIEHGSAFQETALENEIRILRTL